MTRRVVWGLVLAAALLILGAAWFLHTFEQAPVKYREAPEAEAQRNRFLALERFLTRMGRPLQRQSEAALFDRLPAGGTLILDAGRRVHMTPARVERLLTWVEQGGYLLVMPEYGQSDLLLERLRVGPARIAKPQQSRKWPLLIDWPELAQPLRLPWQGSGLSYASEGAERPQWVVADADGAAQILHYARGRGHLTVVTGLTVRLDNRHLGEGDHAELLWTLLRTYQPDPAQPLMLVSRLSVPKLWDWLLESAWMALIAGGLLLLLWLWRIVPRFGPLLPESEPERRRLREHLEALGRYLWRNGGLAHWLTVCRETFLARLAQRHPALADLPPPALIEKLALLTRRPATMIGEALYGPATTPQAFTAAVRTLRNLERIL